ncbi:MAG TPA: NarK family nitrate/nitrite MFS transporter [Burkholderiales bacterium]|nr:NarK family nitrate/nitrite MFS transporter [Burkholderiales bacterium]
MSAQTTVVVPRKQTGRELKIWTPEDKAFWQREGEAIARINLWISVPCLLLAFVVWQLWSVVAVNLPSLGFKFTTNQLFWLAAAPALSGATLRIFYSFMVPVFGGRRWTALSTASLLIPVIGIGFAIQDTTVTYPVFLALALLCGFGGGNFSSSMSNISFFFPKERKGSALGVNAGLGNLGVSTVQFAAPMIVAFSVFGDFGGAPQTIVNKAGVEQTIWAQNAAFIWVPFIALCAVLAWFKMNDIADAKASFAEQSVIFKRKHNWLMCWLYLGTFGSFIGYAAGFPLLIKSQFPEVNALQYAWLGPLVGALVRPVGGWLADRIGGARVTLWNFVVMVLAVIAVIAFLPDRASGDLGNFTGFLLMFMLLFITTGIGNGSTFRMIPVIFLTEHQRAAFGHGQAAAENAIKEANKEAAAVLGFSGAIGAYGGFFIPKSYGSSIAMTGGPEAALYVFIFFYLTCIAITWWHYARKNAPMPC